MYAALLPWLDCLWSILGNYHTCTSGKSDNKCVTYNSILRLLNVNVKLLVDENSIDLQNYYILYAYDLFPGGVNSTNEMVYSVLRYVNMYEYHFHANTTERL